MGHYRSEMIGEEERQEDARFQEALALQGQLHAVPLSSLTFGELQFLLALYGFKHGLRVSLEQLEYLRKIVQKTEAG